MTYLNYTQLGQAKGFKMLNMNVQSLRSKIEKIRKINLCVDHISVTETWLDEGDPDWTVDLNGMTIFRQDRLIKKRKSGGVACYIPNVYVPYPTVLSDFTFTNKDLEILGVMTKYPGHKYRVVLTVYRPPKNSSVARCYSLIKALLKSPFLLNKEVWVLGDLNVNTLQRNSSKCKIMFRFLRETK